jgi:hypothetical protein
MIPMEALITATRVMSDPTIVRVNVGRVRVAWAIGERAVLLLRMSFRAYPMLSFRTYRRGTVCGNVCATFMGFMTLGLMSASIMFFLRNCVDREDQQCNENTGKFFHSYLQPQLR